MGQLYVDTIEPQSGTALTVGETGQNTVLAGNDLRANVFQDAGGNAIFTSNGSGVLSGVNSSFGAAMSLLTTTTVSTAVATVDHTTAISGAFTNTYHQYIWHLINVQPATDGAEMQFLGTTDNTNWTLTKTSCYTRSYNGTANNNIAWGFLSSKSRATSADAAWISDNIGSATAESQSGMFSLYNPSSTTHKKVFQSQMAAIDSGSATYDAKVGGYFMSGSSAVTGIRFLFSSGNIDSGIFKLYGVK